MAEEMKHSCSYCDSEHTQLEFALHKVSNVHVKKVQKRLFQRGFSSVCLICNSALKNLKHVELHVQEQKHTERMRSFQVNSFVSTDKCTCGSCGVTFFSEVVLEAHRLLHSHDSTESPPNTTQLNELFKQLSGLCGPKFLSNGNGLCNLCNVNLDGVEESIMHLFTPAHITRLRSSSCMLCKKDFMHSSDRESHLKSSKHSAAMEKCSNYLEEGGVQTLLKNGGYPCMFCMIWCNSWLCLEIHLLDTHHTRVSAQCKAKYPFPSRIVFLSVSEKSGPISSCDESATSNWKAWRGEALEERIWCHICGVTLLDIDEANRHLTTHGTEKCRATDRVHSTDVLGVSSSPETYECSVCAMSFKNTLMLSAHTACLEHHRRMVAFSSTNTVQCCSTCGLLIDNVRVGNGVDFCKDLKGSLLPGITEFSNDTQIPALVATNEKIIERNEIHLQYAEANSLLTADGSNQGQSKTNLQEVCLVPAGLGQETVSMNKIAANAKKVVDRMLIECNLLMNPTLHTVSKNSNNHVSSESGGFRCSKNRNHMSTSVVVDGNGMLAGQNDRDVVAVGNSTEPNKVHLMHKDRLHSDICVADEGAHSPVAFAGISDNLLQHDKVFLPGEMCRGNCTKLVKHASLADLGIPVVVAATFAPLRNLQESLQSITAIVTETLSSVLPNLYVQQSASSLKRKSEADVDETIDSKRLCAERALEAALQQGLRSVCSNATKSENVAPRLQNCAEEDMVRHSSTEDDKERQQPRAILAVAASLIPSDLPDLSRPPSEQGQAVATKAQESSPIQTVNNKSKRAQESAYGKSESLSKGVVGDQVCAERPILEQVVEGKQGEVETSQLHACSVLPFLDTQKYIPSVAVSPLANDSVKDKESLQASQPVALPSNANSHNSKSESNDDDNDDDEEDDKDDEDDYSFLDPTKSHGKWWDSSDSDDSDSM